MAAATRRRVAAVGGADTVTASARGARAQRPLQASSVPYGEAAIVRHAPESSASVATRGGTYSTVGDAGGGSRDTVTLRPRRCANSRYAGLSSGSTVPNQTTSS